MFPWAGVAPTVSPEVRSGHPVLRSLHGGYAPPSMASLATKAGSTAGATTRRVFGREGDQSFAGKNELSGCWGDSLSSRSPGRFFA